ncbi:urease accessory protein UreF [Jannaschia donghaensis]|uniref:Urease accessory protein UreF n=1 Tax=Jannaschia donghaensis TaxID=420998 RepID=A0A0M6YMI6_9RHOB|nr:urease accessory UreF family protein [Jannaschia donghaensis]CTQ50865.1 Urease accessory protein UreF [Jannaschia donghaensis]
MTTDLLRLTQWLSPAFPVSGYAYSHGLETAMAAGRVRDAATTRDWVRAVLVHGTGPLDVWAIRSVMGGARADDVALTLRARASSAERWAEMRDQGTAFCNVTSAMGEPTLTDLPLPVALGVRARGMDAVTVARLYLQTFAGQMVSAATRFLPLGQTQAQMILRGLHADIAEIADREDADPPGSAARIADLDAMAHETLQPRIFRT